MRKAMLTLNNILKEIKEVPVNRLEEVYQLVHSLTPTINKTETNHKKVISFGGIFLDMTSKDYKEFINYTKKTRAKLLDRNVEI